jgi:hypothetical protein
VWSAATVFVCALELLGRSATSFPPVQFVDKAPIGVSPQAAGYVLAGEARIVLITSTDAFTRARQSSGRCNNLDALREVAGVLAHEEWHLSHGPDEEGAYDAQLIALLVAGAHEDGPLFHKIKQAKLAVVAASNRRTDMGRSARGPSPDD